MVSVTGIRDKYIRALPSRPNHNRHAQIAVLSPAVVNVASIQDIFNGLSRRDWGNG